MFFIITIYVFGICPNLIAIYNFCIRFSIITYCINISIRKINTIKNKYLFIKPIFIEPHMPEKLVLIQVQVTPELSKRLGLLAIQLDKKSKRKFAAELLEKAVESLERKQKEEVK